MRMSDERAFCLLSGADVERSLEFSNLDQLHQRNLVVMHFIL
jgi:hypothetical protein